MRRVDSHRDEGRLPLTGDPRQETALGSMAVHDVGIQLGEAPPDFQQNRKIRHMRRSMDRQAQETKR